MRVLIIFTSPLLPTRRMDHVSSIPSTSTTTFSVQYAGCLGSMQCKHAHGSLSAKVQWAIEKGFIVKPSRKVGWNKNKADSLRITPSGIEINNAEDYLILRAPLYVVEALVEEILPSGDGHSVVEVSQEGRSVHVTKEWEDTHLVAIALGKSNKDELSFNIIVLYARSAKEASQMCETLNNLCLVSFHSSLNIDRFIPRERSNTTSADNTSPLFIDTSFGLDDKWNDFDISSAELTPCGQDENESDEKTAYELTDMITSLLTGHKRVKFIQIMQNYQRGKDPVDIFAINLIYLFGDNKSTVAHFEHIVLKSDSDLFRRALAMHGIQTVY